MSYMEAMAFCVNLSQRSLNSLPAWPLTQTQFRENPEERESRRCQRSRFFTGSLLEVFHPLFFQSFIQTVIPFWIYWESVKIVTLSFLSEDPGQTTGNASSAEITAWISILLFVVWFSAPHFSAATALFLIIT